LKQQPDTPQGRRDPLLMCILLEHGLRYGEIAILPPGKMLLRGSRKEGRLDASGMGARSISARTIAGTPERRRAPR